VYAAENKAELARFAKNFLPILLNLLTSSKERNAEYLSVLETTKAYLTLTDAEVSDSEYFFRAAQC
jgi:ribosomal RNA-processing protein 12